MELQKFAEKAGQEKQLKAVVFLEHRINGKSRGLAYMEFVDYASATKVKEFIERWYVIRILSIFPHFTAL